MGVLSVKPQKQPELIKWDSYALFISSNILDSMLNIFGPKYNMRTNLSYHKHCVVGTFIKVTITETRYYMMIL